MDGDVSISRSNHSGGVCRMTFGIDRKSNSTELALLQLQLSVHMSVWSGIMDD